MNPMNYLTIGVKYCGGCNPEYDRAALAEEIAAILRPRARFVPADEKGVDLVLAIHGCPTACADLSPFGGDRIVNVRAREQGLRWAGAAVKRMMPGDMMKCVDISDR